MWDETDYTARWIQGICAIFLVLFAIADAWFVITNLGLIYGVAGVTLFIGAVRVAWRCATYALTGRNNINRDNY